MRKGIPMKSLMGEGNTPLIPAVSRHLRYPDCLAFKLESTNPSGSYKDRFVAAELSHLMARGVKLCLATSSGNTGSALAAYCARLGIRCAILVNDTIPSGKLVQMRAHGALVLRIPQFVSSPDVTQQVFAMLEDFARQRGAALVVSAFRYCPIGMSGVQAIAHEIAEEMPDVTDVFVPVGGGGLYCAIRQGFLASGLTPRIHAVQPERCPTILRPLLAGETRAQSVESSTTISGLSVPFDIDASRVLQYIQQGAGVAIGVSDEEVLAAQQALLWHEGIYCEPAGAAAFAGYQSALQQGILEPSSRCVCLVTGNGAKDPLSVQRIAERVDSPEVPTDALLETLSRIDAGGPLVPVARES